MRWGIFMNYWLYLFKNTYHGYHLKEQAARILRPAFSYKRQGPVCIRTKFVYLLGMSFMDQVARNLGPPSRTVVTS